MLIKIKIKLYNEISINKKIKNLNKKEYECIIEIYANINITMIEKL